MGREGLLRYGGAAERKKKGSDWRSFNSADSVQDDIAFLDGTRTVCRRVWNRASPSGVALSKRHSGQLLPLDISVRFLSVLHTAKCLQRDPIHLLKTLLLSGAGPATEILFANSS